MHITDFNFELPEHLIALYPEPSRSQCRLLFLSGQSGQLCDGKFTDLLNHVEEGDLMIFNNTQVIPARLFGRKKTGGKVEILIERLLEPSVVLAHVKGSKGLQEGAKIILDGDESIDVTLVAKRESLCELRFDKEVLPILARVGHIPLPPYIQRSDEKLDKTYYQTVYGEIPGAVAAPTAGLHFDQVLMQQLKEKGVDIQFVTLHVGAGTFQPVRVDDIQQHIMHAEYVDVPEQVVDAVKACKARGKRVIAVGTTSVRSLESAASSGEITPFLGDTRIFIYPGFQFNVVDVLITNFHLPESTLIMLVSAFAGYKNTMNAYQHAIQEQYRFFSYGDAMFITRNTASKDEKIA